MPEQFQMLFTQMLDGFALHDIVLDQAGRPIDYRFLAVNPAFEAITGLSADQVVGKTVLEAFPGADDSWMERCGRVALTGESARFESFHAGLGKHFEVIAFRLKTGQFACIFRDISVAKTREAEIERLNHLYAVLSQVNQAIVRADSREELFRSICRVAVEFGQFRLAWIGTLDPASGRIAIEAQQADSRGFPEAVRSNECAAARAALAEGKPVILHELAGGESSAACHIVAVRSGVGSCAAFPIRRRGRAAAALCLHAEAAEFFNSAEIKLLEEVADDISFALDKLDEEAQRRAAEREIREQRQLLSMILEGTLAGYWDWQIQEGKEYLSPGYKRMFGYVGHELPNSGESWRSLIFPEDLPGVLEVLDRHIQSRGRTPFYGEARFRHKNGSTIWVIYTGKVVEWDAAGQAVRMIGCNLDITNRKMVEEDLAREMGFNRAVLENITDAVVACDAAGKLAFFNRTAREWHGEDAAPIPPPDGATPLIAEEVPLLRALRGEDVREAAVTICAKGMPPREVLASGRAIFDDAGKKLGAVVAMHDISERMRHEAERETTLKLLRLLNSPNDTRELIRAVTGYLQEWSGCEAVGIRLREGDDYPYYETQGFGAEFVRAEYSLCAPTPGACGMARLECMCGNVIRGNFDPSLPCFSAAGSFWTNDSLELAATVSEADLRGPFRGRCVGDGYRSLALIPLRSAGETIGLMQFNDHRPDRFTPESIGLLERAAASVASALAQRKARVALIETEQRLQAIIDQTPSLVYVKNLEGQFTLVNHSFESLFGLTREQLLGKSSHDLLPTEIAEVHRANDLEVMRKRSPVYFEEEAKIGAAHHTFLSVKFPITDAKGEVYSVCGISTDITERKRAEKEKSSLEDQLRQAQRLESIGRLAGGIAHDFNNLLTVINGYGDLMRRQLNPGDPLSHFVSEICGAGERASGLTQQLLAFSRKQVIAPKALQLNSLISQTRNMLRRLIGEDIELSTSLDPSLGMVMGDEGLLHQVLMNLAVNSRDAMPNGGILTIETGNFEVDEAYAAAHTEIPPGSYVMMAVSDTGVGIDETAKEHIFEPFFTTKGEGKGTGLGLSTVYGIVRQFGGWIWVYSEPGHGATFRIYLPKTEDAAASQELDKPELGSLRGTETILVVEDQDDVRRLAASVLQSYGYRVLEAVQGGEALLLAENHLGPIELMLTDVVMPRMTGNELAARLAPLRPEMKVLYMSGYAENTIAHQGVLEKGIAFIPKPFTPRVLALKVREVLGTTRSPGSVLVMDANEGVRSLFKQILSGAGYGVSTAAHAEEAVSALNAGAFNLVLTDFAMPEGIDLVRVVRRDYPRLKVIGVSGALGMRPLDKALDLDATLPKPVSPNVLLDAVRKLLA